MYIFSVCVCVSSSLDEVWTDDGDLEMGLLFHCDIVMGTPWDSAGPGSVTERWSFRKQLGQLHIINSTWVLNPSNKHPVITNPGQRSHCTRDVTLSWSGGGRATEQIHAERRSVKKSPSEHPETSPEGRSERRISPRRKVRERLFLLER